MKVVVNQSVGPCFSMSSAGLARLIGLKGSLAQIPTEGRSLEKFNPLYDLPRNDKEFVQVVEELGLSASGENTELVVIEIPDNANWSISDVVGFEYIKVNGEII